MEKIVEVHPAFDKRSPFPNKDYGIHGCELKFLLKGSKGVVQFVIYTNWHLPHVQVELDTKRTDHILCHPLPADIGYHTKCPQYEGQTPVTDSCQYLDGAPCYYDGSGLAAHDLYSKMLVQGDSAIWEELQKWYDDLKE